MRDARVGFFSLLGAALAFLGGCKDSNDITGPLATPTARTATPVATATPPPAPTTTRTLSPTSTPIPPTFTPNPASIDFSGSWTGYFDEEDYKGSSADCVTHVVASASLHQTGSHVDGTFHIDPSACWSGGQIDGSLTPLVPGSPDQTFEGTVFIAGWTGGAFAGRATATTIHIGIAHLTHDNGNGTGRVAPGGLLTLQR